MFVLIHPGTKTAPVTLQSVLKQRHDDLRVRTDKEIARRTAKSIPLDGLVALEEYEPIDGYDDVKLRFVAISDEERAPLQVAVDVAQAARNALTGRPVAEVAAEVVVADKAVVDAEVAFVQKVVDEMETSEGRVDLRSDAVVAAIKATGPLLAHLFVAARDFQGLCTGKEKRFGSAQPSTT